MFLRFLIALAAAICAAAQTQTTAVIVEDTFVSYKTMLDALQHRNLSEITRPGALPHYDVTDLLETIAPHQVTMLNPADALGQPLRIQQACERLSAAIQSDQNLGYEEHIRLARRGARAPLSIE